MRVNVRRLVRHFGSSAIGLGISAAPLVAQSGALRADTTGAGLVTAVRLSGYLQADGRWIGGARGPQADGLLLRRARLLVEASLPQGWQVRLQPDFGRLLSRCELVSA